MVQQTDNNDSKQKITISISDAWQMLDKIELSGNLRGLTKPSIKARVAYTYTRASTFFQAGALRIAAPDFVLGQAHTVFDFFFTGRRRRRQASFGQISHSF